MIETVDMINIVELCQCLYGQEGVGMSQRIVKVGLIGYGFGFELALKSNQEKRWVGFHEFSASGEGL